MSIKIKLIFSSIFLFLIVASLWWGVTTIREKLLERKTRNEAIQNNKIEEATITTIEGWTMEDVAEYLESEKIVTSKDFFAAAKNIVLTDYPYLATLPANASLEGYLFPDTYRVAKGAPASGVLEKMLDNFASRLKTAAANFTDYKSRYLVPGYGSIILDEENKGLTLHELVTLASIVERETGSAAGQQTGEQLLEERKTVAGIFYNRLSIGQALQSDATLNYITQSGRAQANEQDLQLNSPYNTYKFRGLTPGPIGNPSLSSLIAVFHPEKTDYFYFLHSQTTGQVYYARNFDEHTQNKAKYLR